MCLQASRFSDNYIFDIDQIEIYSSKAGADIVYGPSINGNYLVITLVKKRQLEFSLFCCRGLSSESYNVHCR